MAFLGQISQNRFFATLLSVNLLVSMTMPLAWAEEDTTSQGKPGQIELPSRLMPKQKKVSASDVIQQLQDNLQAAQKVLAEREEELKKLQSDAGEIKDTASNGIVPVSTSGVSNNDGLQSAVSGPEDTLKTSVEFYQHHYLLKPGDKLAINFIGETPVKSSRQEIANNDVNDTFLEQVTVLTDGTIVLPPFGIVQVAGRTLKEINDDLNSEIGKYYRFG